MLIEQINATTFQQLTPTGDKVEIGDILSPTFKPHLKLKRWGEECSLDLDLATNEKVVPTISGEKILWEGKSYGAEFYQVEDGYKFNIILKKKSKTNVFPLNFKAKGLKFYYQPELTPEEIAEGCVRPDNVVGSYAVYHATRTNMHASKEDAEKYKCGKAFHWYRPLIWDNSNPRKEVWGELNVDPARGLRTVTIPQDFLDSAVYPITIDDDFGYKTAGASRNEDANLIRGGVYTGAAGTGISMTCSCKNSNETFRLGLYKDIDDSFVIGTNEGKAPASQGWVSADFTSAPTLEAIDYILVFFHGPYDVCVYYDVEADKWYGYESATYPNWPGTASWSNGTDRVYSIYCTYTPAGGVDVTIEVPLATVTSTGLVPTLVLSETLRPNAAGDSTQLTPSAGANWDCVEEAIANDDTDYVSTTVGGYDLYNLPASAGSGNISKIIVHYRCKTTNHNVSYIWATIKSNSTESEETPWQQFAASDTWEDFLAEWTLNPADSEAWEWADIDALQIGIEMGIGLFETIYCTQVYVEVDYTTAGVDVTIVVPLATVDGAGIVPTMGLDRIFAVPLATIASTGLVPIFTLEPDILVPLATINGTGIIPTMVLDMKPAIPLATVTSTGLVPTFVLDVIFSVPLGQINGIGLVPTLSLDSIHTIPLATITALGLTPELFLEFFRGLVDFAGRALQTFTGRGLSEPTTRDLSDDNDEFREMK